VRGLVVHLGILTIVIVAVWVQGWPILVRTLATVVAIALDLAIVAYRRRHIWGENTRLEAAMKARAMAGLSPPPPMGRFKVAFTHLLRSRSMYCLIGEIVEGAVGRGQQVVEPPGIGTVDAIEATTSGDIVLGFRYHDAEQLQRWQALELVGRTLVLRSDGNQAGGVKSG
jgi:hypothetical protein